MLDACNEGNSIVFICLLVSQFRSDQLLFSRIFNTSPLKCRVKYIYNTREDTKTTSLYLRY